MGGLVGFLVGDSDGAKVGAEEGLTKSNIEGDGLRISVGGSDGRRDGLELKTKVGLIVGVLVGLVVGLRLGRELGLSDGTATAQVAQHIFSTDCKEQRNVGSSLAAQGQVCTAPPSSGTTNVPSPAASP